MKRAFPRCTNHRAGADLGAYAAIIGVCGSMDFVVRTAAEPAAFNRVFTLTVRQLDPWLAISHVHTCKG